MRAAADLPVYDKNALPLRAHDRDRDRSRMIDARIAPLVRMIEVMTERSAGPGVMIAVNLTVSWFDI